MLSQLVKIFGLVLAFMMVGILYQGRLDAQIRGFVIDGATSEPIPGAAIRQLDSKHRSIAVQSTHPNGEFRITLLSTAISVQVHAVGYLDTVLVVTELAAETKPIRVLLKSDPFRHDEVTITAERHLEAIQNVPVSVSTVDAQEIHSRAPEGLDNILRYIPGVSVTDKEVNIRGSSGYARSIGSRVLLLLDGMPFLTADNGDIDFDALPIFDIERVEVVKGAGSALYGSSALGGVVNVITRAPADGFHGAFQATGGMYDNPLYSQWVVPGLGRQFGNADIGGSGSFGDVRALASVGYMRNEGYRLGDDYYRWHAFAKVGSRLSESSSLDLSAVLANENHGGWLYWKSLSQPLLPSDSLSAVNGRTHSFKTNVLANYSTTIGENFIGSLKANVLHTAFITDESQPGANDGDHSTANAVNIEADGSVPISSLLFLTTGLTSSFQTVTSDLYQNHNGIVLGAFAQGEIKPVDDMTITAGGRYDHIQYDQLAGDGQFSPKAGITYQLTSELSTRASYGYGFRAPAIAERFTSSKIDGFLVDPNPNLQAERSNSYEYGLTYSASHLKLDGSMFYSTFDHLIQPTFVTTQGPAYIQFQNITKAQLFGHEEVMEWYPFGGKQALFRVSYTYVFPQDEITKQILEFRPRHLFQAHAEATIGLIMAGIDFRYISPYETFDSTLAIMVVKDGDRRVPIKVLDARIGFSLESLIGEPVELTLQALNLLNYYYVEIVGNMAPLRSFSLQIQSRF